MSPIEQIQSESTSGRRTIDAALVGFIVAVSSFIGLGAAGVL